MKKDVHAAALHAASKVAFSVAFLAGCSTDRDPEESSGQQEVVAAAAGADASACVKERFGCTDLVETAFPVVGQYPGKTVTVSAAVAQCCGELLIASDGAMARRWDCCANHLATDDEKIGVACTPWGPPVPPAMNARRVAISRAHPIA